MTETQTPFVLIDRDKLAEHTSILQHLIEHIDCLVACDDCRELLSDTHLLTAYAHQALFSFQAALDKTPQSVVE